MADGIVGRLKAIISLDTSPYEAGAKKAQAINANLEKGLGSLGKEFTKLTPQAERMVKSLGGDKLLYTANSLTQAITKLGGAHKLTEGEQSRHNRTLADAISKYAVLGQKAPAAMVALEQATRKAGTPTKLLTTSMIALGAAVGTFLSQLALRGVSELVSFGAQAFAAAGHILDLSNKTGLSATTIQQMQFVADQTGSSLESMTDASFKLGVRIASNSKEVSAASEELRKYGLETDKLRQMRPDEQWNAVTAALGRVENETERNRLGVALMGRGFATVAAAVGEGYLNLASQAKVSTDAQLKELDRLSDEWTKFKRNLSTGFGVAMGRAVLEARIRREVAAEALTSGGTLTDMEGEVQRRLFFAQMFDAKTKDIKLTADVTAAEKSYAQQLASVRAELARLTPAQRSEIDAAQQLGVSTDDLENKYGLSDGALRILSSQTKDYEKNLKSSASASEKAAAEADKLAASYRDVANFIGEREIEDAANAIKQREADERAYRQVLNDLGEQEIADHAAALKAKEASEREWRDVQNDLGVRAMEDEAARLEIARAQAERVADAIRSRIGAVGHAALGNLGALLFGFGNDNRELKRAADEAEQDYLRIKRSGKATAEELTLAFKRFHEAEERANHGFAERFKDVWQGVKTTLQGILNEILEFFVKRFLVGLVKGMAGARLGQTLGSAISGSVAGAALGGGASALSTSALMSAVPGLAAGGAGASAGGAAAAGGAAGGGGSALAALATNPWTIGIAGGLVLGGLIWKKGLFRGGEEALKVSPRRDKFTGQFGGDHALAAILTSKGAGFGGGHLFSVMQRADTTKEYDVAQSAIAAFLGLHGQRNVKMFGMGGFVPPGAVQPAILHGGSMGELVTPVSQLSGRSSTSVTFNIYAMDGADVHRVVRTHIVPDLKQMLQLNTDDFRGHMSRVLAP